MVNQMSVNRKRNVFLYFCLKFFMLSALSSFAVTSYAQQTAPAAVKSAQASSSEKVSDSTVKGQAGESSADREELTAADAGSKKCKLGKFFEVAIIAAGNHKNTSAYFTQIMRFLGEKGLIKNNLIKDTYKFGLRSSFNNSVSKKVNGECLNFSPDNFYFANWEPSVLESMVSELKEKAERKEVDLIISFGDQSTFLFSELNLDIPVVGVDVNTVLEKYQQQNKLFVLNDSRNIKDDVNTFISKMNFKSIGFVRDKNHIYDKNIVFDEVKKTAEEHNVSLKVCEGKFFTSDEYMAHSEFSRCVTELAESGIDGFFIPEVGNGIDIENFFSQIKPLLNKRIAVISSDSRQEVEAGSLLSLYDYNEETRARFAADAIEYIVKNHDNFSGMPDVMAVPMFFALNLRTAGLIQWRPDFDLLVAVDNIYNSIGSN